MRPFRRRLLRLWLGSRIGSRWRRGSRRASYTGVSEFLGVEGEGDENVCHRQKARRKREGGRVSSERGELSLSSTRRSEEMGRLTAPD